VTSRDRAAVVERYVATGERPEAIAAGLGLDPAEVAAMLEGGTAHEPARAAATRPKRSRKRAAEPAPASPSAPADDYTDPGMTLRGRNGEASHRNHGYGYASIRTGGRGWL
jgi:hypothetical protein